jgi:hypothetical protein
MSVNSYKLYLKYKNKYLSLKKKISDNSSKMEAYGYELEGVNHKLLLIIYQNYINII